MRNSKVLNANQTTERNFKVERRMHNVSPPTLPGSTPGSNRPFTWAPEMSGHVRLSSQSSYPGAGRNGKSVSFISHLSQVHVPTTGLLHIRRLQYSYTYTHTVSAVLLHIHTYGVYSTPTHTHIRRLQYSYTHTYGVYSTPTHTHIRRLQYSYTRIYGVYSTPTHTDIRRLQYTYTYTHTASTSLMTHLSQVHSYTHQLHYYYTMHSLHPQTTLLLHNTQSMRKVLRQRERVVCSLTQAGMLSHTSWYTLSRKLVYSLTQAELQQQPTNYTTKVTYI